MTSETEKTKVQLPQSNDDGAGGRFWEIYANEAKEYDEGLVQSWKDDMDVILVFSGLYSAVLTAFVIESYQTLQEDPADVSAQLLQTISLQLAVPSNALNVTQTTNVPFTPSASALACNILWFISLSLSLICAFMAMFIQQWCRHFMHRITLDRSPIARARLIQFFYFGLRTHRMHIIVDVIPYLLHVSLFYFFGGLSAFLWSINRPLAWLILAVLALLVMLYAIITLLPVFWLSSPYQTPLSSVAWRLRQVVERVWIHWPRPSSRTTDPEKGLTKPARTGFVIQTHSASPNSTPQRTDEGSKEKWPTLLQAMVDCGRNRRPELESQSIAWTLTSLTDDKDFLTFIEALPGVLEDHHGLRHDNLHLLEPILDTTISHCDVIARAHWLLFSANNPRHSDKYQERCRTSVSAFFWVLSRLPFVACLGQSATAQGSTFRNMTDLRFPNEVILTLRPNNPSDAPKRDHSLSIMVLCMLNNCCSLDGTLSKVVEPQALHDLITLGEEIFTGYSYRSERGFLSAGWCLQFKENLTIGAIVSHLFFAYLQVAGMHFPLGFGNVCSIFHRLGIKPTKPNQGLGNGLFASLTFQLYLLDEDSHRRTAPSLDYFHSIFKTILKSSTMEDLPGIASYISRQVELGWFMTTEWRDEELQQLCNILTKASHASFPIHGNATWADACRWIIVYGHNRSKLTSTTILPMLEHIIQSHNIEAYPSLAFVARLTIIKNYNHDENEAYRSMHKRVLDKLRADERFKALVLDTDPIDLNPYTDRRFGSTITPRRAEICSGERGINGSLLLIQALTMHLSLPECREILEYFYYLSFPGDSVAFLARQPTLLHELVRITKEFFTLWVASPSTDLIDINRLLWRIWRSIVSNGLWKDPNPWRDLDPERKANQRNQRQDLNSQKDPGPWGDHNPWTDQNLPCLSELHPLLDLANAMLSNKTIENQSKHKQIRLYAEVDDFDLALDVTNVRERLATLSKTFPQAFTSGEVTQQQLLSKHVHLDWSQCSV